MTQQTEQTWPFFPNALGEILELRELPSIAGVGPGQPAALHVCAWENDSLIAFEMTQISKAQISFKWTPRYPENILKNIPKIRICLGHLSEIPMNPRENRSTSSRRPQQSAPGSQHALPRTAPHRQQRIGAPWQAARGREQLLLPGSPWDVAKTRGIHIATIAGKLT